MKMTQLIFNDSRSDTLGLWRRNKKVFLSIAVILMGIIACAGFVLANAQEGEDFEIRWIIPRENYIGNFFYDGRAWVQREKGGAWTLYDVEGNVIKDGFEVEFVGPYQNGFARFNIDTMDKHGFVDISGDIVVPPIVANRGALLSDGLINDFNEEGWHGFVDINGEWVIPAEYGDAESFSEGLAAVRKNGKWGYINKSGAVVIDFVFDMAAPFLNGAAVVSQNSRCGLIDNKGAFLIEPIYEEYFNFGAKRAKDDLIEVVKNDMVGFINRSGDIVIDFKFHLKKHDGANIFNIFRNGRAVVFLNEDGHERAVIDEEGDIVFKIEDDMSLLFPVFQDDYICAGRGLKIVVFDRNGKVFNFLRYIDFPTLSTNNVFSTLLDRGSSGKERTKLGYFVISQ